MIHSRSEEEPRRQSARRGFTQILAGTAVGQILTFIAFPFLSRLYTPDQFGILTFALSLVAILVPIALMGFDQAVVLPREDRTVAPIATVATTFLLIVSVALAGLILWGPLAATVDPALRPFLSWALPCLLLVNGLTAIFTQFAIRRGRYGSIGSRNTAQSIVITMAQLGLSGTARSGTFNGLVSGALIGSAVGATLLLPYMRGYVRRTTLRECLDTVRGFWRFPVIFAPMTALTLLAQQTPVIFVIYWFGVSDAGQVGMAERIVAVPLALIGMAANSVFSGEISQALRTHAAQKTRIYLKTSLWLCGPGVLALIGLLFFATFLLPTFLGEDWRTASLVAQSMALVAATRMIANPVRSVFRVLGRARVLTVVELIRVALLAGAIFLAIGAGFDLFSSLTSLFVALALADATSWFAGLLVSRQADRSSAPLE